MAALAPIDSVNHNQTLASHALDFHYATEELLIHIIVTMIVKAGRMQEFLAECDKLRPLVLAEQGCIEYVYTRDTASPLGIQEPINANRITWLKNGIRLHHYRCTLSRRT